MSVNRVNDDQEDRQNQHIADILGLCKDEVDEWKIGQSPDESEGVIYGEIITFSQRTPRLILDKAGVVKGQFHIIMCELFSDRG
ncbi:hypothetical protein D3C76_323190 [compost metagenome]